MTPWLIRRAKPVNPPGSARASSVMRVSLFLRVFDATPEAVASFRRLASLDMEITCFGRGVPVVGSPRERLALVPLECEAGVQTGWCWNGGR